MKSKAIYSTFAVVIILMLTGCAGKSGEEAREKKETKEAQAKVITLSVQSIAEIGLSLSSAELKQITGELVAPAKLLPNQDLEAQVGSFVQGRVDTVFVNLGDHVQKGQELMHIEGLEIGEIKAKAQLNAAEATLKRQKTLLEEKVGSQKALIEAQAEYEKALAELNAEDRKIHSIGLTHDDVVKFVEDSPSGNHSHVGGILPIKAPIDGLIVERNVVIGQLIDATTNAFKIVNASMLWADGQLYEKDAPSLVDKPAITVTVSAYPNEQFKGRVIYVGETVDEQTRTVKIRAVVPNQNRKLKPEMFAEMHIPINVSVQGVIVPGESVVKDKTENYVFVATSDSTFEKRNVVLGREEGELVEIKQGVQPGERIVTKGTFFLKSELMKEYLGGGE
jgi:cobalt-zinc-cadmium efflux system membrane fusion protein